MGNKPKRQKHVLGGNRFPRMHTWVAICGVCGQEFSATDEYQWNASAEAMAKMEKSTCPGPPKQ